jgi:hypothetical protein
MADVPVDLRDLVGRLEKVERQNRFLKLWGLLIPLLLLTGAVSLTTSSLPKVITAEKICLTDKNGIARLKMELENGNPQLTLTYENGDPCLVMGPGELCFYDQGKKARINIMARDTLNFTSLALTDKEGKNCVTVSAGPEGPYLSIDDSEGKKEVVLSIDPIGTFNMIEMGRDKP